MARSSAADVSTARTRSVARRGHRTTAPCKPGRVNRKQQKPQDSGYRAEERTRRLLERAGVVMWRNPGITGYRLTGKGMRPDYVLDLPELREHLAPYQPPNRHKLPVTGAGSHKTQHRGGSVEQKIDTEIPDMAASADVTRIVPFVLVDTSGGVFTPGQVASWKVLGERHLVVVLTVEEALAGLLMPALVAMARRRAALYTRMTRTGGLRPRSGRYRFTGSERAYLERRERLSAALAANG